MAYSREQLIARIYATADAYGIDRAIAHAQLKRESGFRDDVIYGPTRGTSGERGIAQAMPKTWASIMGSVPHTEAYNVDTCLEFYGKLMRYLLQRFNGRYELALAAYNGGESWSCLKEGKITCMQQQTQTYVAAIITAAGKAPAGDNNQPSNDAGNGLSDWLQYWPFAAAGLVLIWFLSDD